MLRGIDVSRWQGNIDWNKAKKDIDFAVVKMSQGGNANIIETNPVPYLDPYFKTNVNGAYSAGISRIGVYHYLAGTTVETVKKEAQYVIDNLAPYKHMISLPVALDIEDMPNSPKYKKLSKTLNGQLVKAFRDALRNAGYETMLYSNRNFLTNIIDMDNLKDMQIWYARWSTGYVVTDAWEKTVMSEQPNTAIWQYGTGSVSGISGNVDVNMGYFKEIPVTKPNVTLDNTPDAWGKDAVNWITSNKIMLGDENGNLKLHDNISRQEYAVMLKRYHDKFGK